MDIDQKLDRIESKIDKVVEDISSIDSTLAAQHEQIKEHIRRTALLEDDIKPLKQHVSSFNAVLRFLGVILLISGAIEGIVSLLTYLKR
jgi:archaellum component FlaC